MIKCLPRDVQEELRSTVAVPSLQQCVEELVLNSIDAGATCVGVRMDLEAFKVQVIDNGVGMGAEDMHQIGNRYHTSKCSTVDDLDQLRFYGFRGEAVASLVSLASLVEITSKTRTSANTLVKVFKHGNGSDVFQSDTDRPSAGTTVVICNFFHNLPVRRKRTDPVLEGERIRHRLEAVSLMQTSVSFTLKNDATGTMMVQLPKARDMYHRFTQIHGLARAQKLGQVRHSRAQFEVVGFLGREGHYNSSLQYLYINDRFLLKTRIHLLLSQLLRQLGNKHSSPEKPTSTRSPKQKRQELHAVYVINITCPHSEYDVCLEPAKTLVEFKDWDGVLLCVEEAVKSFLVRENLDAAVQDDSDDCDPAVAEEDTGLNGDGASPDCSSWITLASENVYRKFRSETCEQAKREKTTSGPEPASDGELGNVPKVEDEDDEEGELQSDAIEQDSKEEEEETGHKTMRLLSVHRFDSLQALSTECRSLSKGKRSGEDLQEDVAPKIPRCERISLSNQFGSLDAFRRLYGKAEKPTRSSQSLLDQKDLPGSGKVLKSPTGLAVVSKFKPNPVLSGPKPSLAAKLNQLKQNTGPKAVQNNGPAQDANNNKRGSEPVQGEDLDSVAEGSGDWLHHYSACAGRTVYVNKRTGLSRYQEPEENRFHCTSDVTNMAVSVVSEEGGERRCYPFQGDLVLPFLPKSRLDRVLSAGTGDRGEGSVSSSLSSMYSKWKNPVFVRPPQVGVDVSSVQTEWLKVKIHNILFPYRFTKDMIPSMKVIDQVDRKFMACLINTTEEAADEGNLLVLLDQHAAHERVRLETLVADSYEETTEGRRLSSSNIVPPLEVQVPDEELRLLRSCEDQLSSLGLELTFPLTPDSPLLVHSVPLCFLERERNEVRRRRASVIKPLVEELLREQTELLRESGRVKGTLPLTVLNVLASLACHGAIKFNDQLSKNECRSLVASLSSCQLPFQCAHGRPSIAPLVDFLHVDLQPEESLKPNLRKLARMYKSWQLCGNT